MANGGGDFLKFEASFAKLDEGVAQVVARLEEQLTSLRAQGDTVRTAQVEAQIGQLQKFSGAGQAAQVQETISALEQERAALARNLEINVENLNVLRLQAEQVAALNSLTREGVVAPRIILPAERRGVASGEQTAGGQVALQGQRAQVADINAQLAEQNALRARSVTLEEVQLAEDRARATEIARQTALLDEQLAANRRSYSAGAEAGLSGGLLGPGQRAKLTAPSKDAGLMAGEWTAGNAALAGYNATLGEYDALSTRANLGTKAMTANLTRLGVAEANASNQLRQHGALTTEWLGALARGETTLSELGYQVGATVAKFGGWVTAAAAVYGAFSAVKQFGAGAAAAANGVEQLHRTLGNINPSRAAAAFESLSSRVNVPIKQAAEAVFEFSRTFHNLDDATEAARQGLMAFKLDNVSVADSVKLQTALTTQFGVRAQDMGSVYDRLAAGQREWNARVTEMVPLLANAAGAIKNAGGDFNQFMQIGVFAQRALPGVGGSRLAQVFTRSAVQYLDPTTTGGQKNISGLEALGVDAGHGWTQTFISALRRSLTMSPKDITSMVALMFGPRLGGQVSGLFTPQAARTGLAIMGVPGYGDPRRAITPAATRGTRDKEFEKEEQQLRERVHTFTNEMQRMGAALGASGVLQLLSRLVTVFTAIGGAFRGVVDAFDQLPGAAKQAVEGLVLLRAAMLLMSHTRFGASIPGSRFARIPGIDPSYEGQNQRAELARGGRAAITAVEQDLAQTTAKQNAIAARQLELATQAERLQVQIADTEGASGSQRMRYNAMVAKVAALGKEELALEDQRLAQAEALTALKAQQVGLTGSRANPRTFSDKQVAGIYAGAGPATLAGDTTAAQRLAVQKENLASLQRLNATATGEVAAANRADIAAMEANIAATEAAAATTTALTAAEGESTVAATGFRARLGTMAASARGFGSKLGMMAGALDPLTAALIGVPIAMGLIKGAMDKAAAATKQATEAEAQTVSSIQALSDQAVALEALSKKLQKPKWPGGGIGAFAAKLPLVGGIWSADDSAKLVGLITGNKDLQHLSGDPSGAAKAHAGAGTQAFLARNYRAMQEQFRLDGAALARTDKGRQEMYREEAQLRGTFAAILSGSSGLSKGQVGALFQAFSRDLAQTRGHWLAAFQGAKNVGDALDALEHMPNLDVIFKPAAARADVYGLSHSNINQAIGGYLLMAARYRSSTDPQQLQQLQSAQQTLTSAVTKNVQDLLKAAQQSTTQQGASSLIGQAINTVHQEQAKVRQWERQMEKRYAAYPAIIKAVQQAADMLDGLLGEQLQAAIQADLDAIKTQSDYKKSLIQGSGPGAEVARAQQELTGLQQEYSKAQANGADWKTLMGLLTQINDAKSSLAKTELDNARSLAEAQGGLAVASITGTSPADDIARARAEVSKAQQMLAFDQAHGADQQQIIQDQIALYGAIHSLNSTMQQQAQQAAQDAAALIQAQAAYAESQTLDPIKQAKEELAAQEQILGTIQSSNYQTASEYQAALLQQRTKINEARTKVQEAIIQQDLRTLQFEFNTQKIGDQAYINGLERILKTKKMALQERQQIEEQIYNLKQGMGKELQLNVGQIKLPSIYQIRRAIGLGQRGEMPGAQNTVINHSASVIVNVYGTRGAGAVGAVLDQHLNTSVRAAMRARGVV